MAIYVILVYDVNKKRVGKVLKIARKYLSWMQNSVLEGLITEKAFERLKSELDKVINEKEDSLIYYIIPSGRKPFRYNFGYIKGFDDIIISTSRTIQKSEDNKKQNESNL